MKLYDIPKNWILTQGFGLHPEWYSSLGLKGHDGLDYTKSYGSPIPALHDAIIGNVRFNGNGYGNSIDILGQKEDGKYLFSLYGHLTGEKIVKPGQPIKDGEIIGYMGNSGYVISNGIVHYGEADPTKGGTHLHLTTRWLQDVSSGEQANYFINSKGYIDINKGNGFNGAFDPNKLFYMSNVIFVHKEGTDEFGFYVPATSEEALRDKAKNFGIDILVESSGKIDFDKAKNIK